MLLTLQMKHKNEYLSWFVSFQMPLSKKLKANAMAALFKTQSGFTVKRKGSTSSLMSAGMCISEYLFTFITLSKEDCSERGKGVQIPNLFLKFSFVLDVNV